MTTAGSNGIVVILHGPDESSSALRDGLSEQYRVVSAMLGGNDAASEDPVAAAIQGTGAQRYSLVGISAGADAALRHAMREPDRVEVLALISPSSVRPTNADAASDLESRLGEVQSPTLVVFGQEDRSVRRDAASIYRERVPNCSIAFVYDAGHDIAAERPQALVNLVSDYLERRETFIVQNRTSVINP